MRIGDVSKQTGIPTSTLRYYERIGLLHAPQRVNGQRHYDVQILEVLQIIRLAKSANFSLDDIRQLLQEYQEGQPMSDTWRSIARQKQLEVLDAIQSYQQMLETLQTSIDCTCQNLTECELIS